MNVQQNELVGLGRRDPLLDAVVELVEAMVHRLADAGAQLDRAVIGVQHQAERSRTEHRTAAQHPAGGQCGWRCFWRLPTDRPAPGRFPGPADGRHGSGRPEPPIRSAAIPSANRRANCSFRSAKGPALPSRSGLPFGLPAAESRGPAPSRSREKRAPDWGWRRPAFAFRAAASPVAARGRIFARRGQASHQPDGLDLDVIVPIGTGYVADQVASSTRCRPRNLPGFASAAPARRSRKGQEFPARSKLGTASCPALRWCCRSAWHQAKMPPGKPDNLRGGTVSDRPKWVKLALLLRAGTPPWCCVAGASVR